MFLHKRSNFHRFAPEIGIADALASVVLVGKTVVKGWKWKEAVLGVMLIREGIGEGDLWWREGVDAGGAGASGEEVPGELHSPGLNDLID